MPTRIDFSSIVEEIKFRNPIEDVISSFVTLKRTGNTLKGLCPFHSERTPSFTVYPQTSSYYCFGCGAAGDVISFVMKSENLDYIDAVKTLAQRSGIVLPEDDIPINKGTGRQKVLEMNLIAAKFFRSALFDPVIGQRGMVYINDRKVPSAVVKHFGLGYAPDSFDMLYNHLKHKGFSDVEMQDAFLCKKSDKTSKYYDIFRDRIIFPIIDNSGNVIAFGGRRIEDSKSPQKYINTSDTPAFKKTKNLFALNFARDHCSEKMIVCEGYMDVIAMHSAKVENSVATLGTAITPDHARLLKRYTKKVVLAYDSDSAGQQATERAMRVLAEVGLESSVLVINGAKDPDEFITRYGADEFRRLVDSSRTKFEFKIEKAIQNRDLTVPEERIKAVSEMCEYISGVSSKVEREVYISQTAKKFGVTEESLTSDIVRLINQRKRSETKKKREQFIVGKRGFGDKVNRDFVKFPKLAKLEETVIGIILLKPEYIKIEIDGKILSSDDFKTEFCSKVYSFVSEQFTEGCFNSSLLFREFNEEEASKAYGLMNDRAILGDNSPDVFKSNVIEMRTEAKSVSSETESYSVDSILNTLNQKKEQ